MHCVTGILRVALALSAAPCMVAGSAMGQQAIGGYQAYIGPADLVNSNGIRLTQAWQVIRQDRANVHRFGVSQPGDERDPWFGSGEMRNALESWLRQGGLDAATAAVVMAGGASVYVEVFGQGGRVSGARVRLDAPAGAAGGGGLGGGLGGSVAESAGATNLVISPE